MTRERAAVFEMKEEGVKSSQMFRPPSCITETKRATIHLKQEKRER